MSPQFVNFTAEGLCAGAGGDPWKVNQELQAGDAGAINSLADAFHASGKRVKEADDVFSDAKKKFNESWKRNDSEHPINDSEEVQRVSTALAGHPEELSKIAANLEQVAAALARAQRDSAAQITDLEEKLHSIDDQITSINNQIGNGDGDGDDDKLESQKSALLQSAKDTTKAALGTVEEIRGGYIAQLHGAEAAMMASGYAPDAIDDVDGAPGDAPGDVARRYEESGQRQRDQDLVDRAKAAGKSDSVIGTGQPGHFTKEEAAAEARLRDYKIITDPIRNDPTGRAPSVVAERSRDRRLAGERLDDYLVANSTGPVAKDTVLGGDARTRAQARLDLQEKLERGGLSWHPQSMTPEKATQLMDEMEVTDRANALAKTEGLLVEQCGLSKPAAARIVDDLAHGVPVQSYVDAAAAASKVFDAGGDGIAKFGEGIRDTGSHWTPDARDINRADVESFAKLGKYVGRAGSVLEVGTAIYELANGAPVGEVAAKSGGGMAGAWALGELGAEGGFAVAGPPGAFVGALVFGTAGAFLGESVGEKAYKWITE